MADGKVIFRVSARDAGRVATKYNLAARMLDEDIRLEIDELSKTEQAILEAAAPEDTGRTRGGIEIRPAGGFGTVAFEITGSAIDPDSGYDYFDVTRFGHRKRVIIPHPPKRYLSFRDSNVWPKQLARSVRGASPASDWVADARTALDRAAAGAGRRLGRRVRTRLL